MCSPEEEERTAGGPGIELALPRAAKHRRGPSTGRRLIQALQQPDGVWIDLAVPSVRLPLRGQAVDVSRDDDSSAARSELGAFKVLALDRKSACRGRVSA